eukprot:10736075-Ditylum_brightwellii.AAC.1
MDLSDTAKPKRDGNKDSINKPTSEDEVKKTADTSSGFPRHDGVDNNARIHQTSEAAVMKKMKMFGTVEEQHCRHIFASQVVSVGGCGSNTREEDTENDVLQHLTPNLAKT